MAASSATGTGTGSCEKPTTKELAAFANGPSILIAGYGASSESEITSPPSPAGSIRFPSPLPGGSENYVVSITTIAGGNAFVYDMIENDNGDFIGFGFATEEECDFMYLVVKAGIKAA